MALRAKHLLADQRLLFVLALCAITFFVNLGKAPIYILDEAKNTQCAREMLENHQWFKPTYNQVLRTDKPPLHYFFMAAAYSMFGVNEFSARFFSAVCGLLVVVFTYRFAARHINREVGLMSSLILLASWQFGLEMRLGVPDAYLILLVNLTLFNLYDFYNSGLTKQRCLLAAYIFMSLGLLSKGPVALLLPLIIIIIYLLIQKQLNFHIIGKFKPITGLLIIAIIGLPWYYIAGSQSNGVWTQEFFFKHNVGRFISSKENHGGIFILPLVYVLVGLLPVSVFLFHAAFHFYKRAATSNLVKLLGISVLTVLVFFMLSKTKLPNYPMPIYPLLGILLANYLHFLINANKNIKPYITVLLIIGIAIPVALKFAIVKEEVLKHLSFVWLPFVVLPIGLLAALLYQYVNSHCRTQVSVYLVLFTFILTGWIFNLYAYPKVYTANPVMASLKKKNINEPLVGYKTYNAAYNFYLKSPIKRFENVADLKSYLNNHRNVQITIREKHIHELDSLHLKMLYRGKDIFESHVNYLLQAQ